MTLQDQETLAPASTAIITDSTPPQNTAQQAKKQSVFGSFWIETTEFALPVEVVQEVVNEPEQLTSVPLSPPHVLGLFY